MQIINTHIGLHYKWINIDVNQTHPKMFCVILEQPSIRSKQKKWISMSTTKFYYIGVAWSFLFYRGNLEFHVWHFHQTNEKQSKLTNKKKKWNISIKVATWGKINCKREKLNPKIEILTNHNINENCIDYSHSCAYHNGLKWLFST